jgi:hypothetical protein
MFACGRVKLDPYLSACAKISSTLMKDLSIRPDTSKLLEEYTGTLWDTDIDYLNGIPIAQEIQVKTDQCGCTFTIVKASAQQKK